MVRLRALVTGLLCATACAAGETTRTPPESAVTAATPSVGRGVRPLGRYDATDPPGLRFAWSGTGVAVRFHGRDLAVRLKGGGGDALEVIVDGVPTTTITLLSNRDQLYPLARGLAEADHDVVLVKRTEARVGEIQLLGFDQPLLDAPPARARRIEIVGDSITAGYGNEGPSERCHFTPQTENAYMAYGWQTARALDADVSMIAWSGRTIDVMSDLYDRALPGPPARPWDAHAFEPDVVVVNLGTNDVTRGDGQAQFVGALSKLIDRIRATHPKALVVCCIGPMLTDTYPPGKQTLTHARAWVRQAVDAKRTAGESRIRVLEFPTQDPAAGYGCDYHPSMKTHQRMAEQLTAFLKKEMGW